MSFASRLVLLFAIATLLISAPGSFDPSSVASGLSRYDADTATAEQPDDSEEAIELVNPSLPAFASPTALEPLAHGSNLLLHPRSISPLDQPPRSSRGVH